GTCLLSHGRHDRWHTRRPHPSGATLHHQPPRDRQAHRSPRRYAVGGPAAPMNRPALIMVAPNGARRTKADHPALPVDIAETAATAARCREAGASAVHAHLRDREGRHVLDADGYRELIAAIRREAGRDMVVQITTEAVGRYSPAEQRAVVDSVHPDAASIALAEMIPDATQEAEAAAFYARCAARNIAIQHILYDPVEFECLTHLVRLGIVVGEGMSVLFVLGR